MAGQVVAATLVGCIGCQAGVEFLQTKVSESLNLLTFVSTVFTALVGLVAHSKFFSVPNKIPIRSYIHIVVIYFVINAANNYAIKFDVYFPLFIIFKSGTLLMNMLLGAVIRRYRYTMAQVTYVTLVSIGLIIFTLASYEPRPSQAYDPADLGMVGVVLSMFSIPPFVFGIGLLSLAVVLSAYLGICQEQVYAAYGKHNNEMLFYVHFLSIPAFALLGENLAAAWTAANRTSPVEVLGWSLPSAWLYIFAICLLQYVCVHNVYKLSSVTSSLDVTMVITVRKVLSLGISFFLFSNPFNAWHVVGAILVFVGSYCFSTF